MDNTTSHSNSQFAAQRKFYQWILKWINGFDACAEFSNEESQDVRNARKPDVSTIACLLQAIGFKLLSFEKQNETGVRKKGETDASTLKITIECANSSMKATLEMEDVTCRCPNSDHIKDASFWSVSGTGPTGSTDNIVQKVEETGSNLLPRLSKDIVKVFHDVTYKFFEIITSEPDVNRNTNNLNTSRSGIAYLTMPSYDSKIKEDASTRQIGVVRSYTQPEICINSWRPLPESRATISASSSQHKLNRQETYDIVDLKNRDDEPRPSPPKITSSPTMIAELSQSLGQLSLQSEAENQQSLAEYIIGAQQNLEKALRMLSFKKPVNRDLSPTHGLSDQDGASVKSAPPNVSPAVVNPIVNAIANVKPMPKSSNATEKQRSARLNSKNVTSVPKARVSLATARTKSESENTRGEQNATKFRRRSFYLSSTSNTNLSVPPRPSGSGQKSVGKCDTTKTNNTTESNLANRTYTPAKKLVSPERRHSMTPNLETLGASKTHTPSMIKPPSKITRSLSAKIKPVQSSAKDTGVSKKSRMSLSKK